MTFADKLKELRSAAGMSQSELSAASGLSLGVIRDYEQTEKLPSLPSAVKLTTALGISLDVFRDCFTQEPAETAPAKPGRPRKVEPEKPAKKTRKKGG